MSATKEGERMFRGKETKHQVRFLGATNNGEKERGGWFFCEADTKQHSALLRASERKRGDDAWSAHPTT